MVIHEAHLDAAPVLFGRECLDGGETRMARGDADHAIALGNRAPGNRGDCTGGYLYPASWLALSGSLSVRIDARGIHTGRPAVHLRHDLPVLRLTFLTFLTFRTSDAPAPCLMGLSRETRACRQARP